MSLTPEAKETDDSAVKPVLSQEAALLDFAERIARQRGDRVAVHLHLSRLQPGNRRPALLEVATSIFTDLVALRGGQIFTTINHDIVYACKGVALAELEPLVDKVRQLFADDPLASGRGGELAVWYRLPGDFPVFLDAVRALQALPTSVASAAPPRPAPRRAVGPALLARVIDSLGHVDLGGMVRQQTVCAFQTGAPPQPMFDAFAVSLDALEQALLGDDVSLSADPWLLRHLNRTLDRKLISHLVRDAATLTRSFGLSLSLGTLLSPDFRRLEKGLGVAARSRMIVELDTADIFHDLGAYLFAREMLREHGAKLCLTGVTRHSLPFIDRERLGIDLIKIAWSDDVAEAAGGKGAQALGEAVGLAGRARVILTDCDSAPAIAAGQAVGITLFQGRHVAELLSTHPEASPPLPPRAVRPARRSGQASPVTGRR